MALFRLGLSGIFRLLGKGATCCFVFTTKDSAGRFLLAVDAFGLGVSSSEEGKSKEPLFGFVNTPLLTARG
jgi:hypothetical protein